MNDRLQLVEFYAARFNRLSDVLPDGGRVTIRPGAFTAALRHPAPVPLRIDHAGPALAWSGAGGRLLLCQDKHGLLARAELRDDAEGRAIVEAIRTGRFKGGSFCYEGAVFVRPAPHVDAMTTLGRLLDVSVFLDGKPVFPETRHFARAIPAERSPALLPGRLLSPLRPIFFHA